MTEFELRDYLIAEGHLDDFVEAWLAGVLPLRRRFGFEVAAWVDVKRGRFVWLLQYDGPSTFDQADADYYASPERVALDPDPAQWIVENISRRLAPVAADQFGRARRP